MLISDYVIIIIMYPRLVAKILNINKSLILYKELLHNKKLFKTHKIAVWPRNFRS